MKGYIHYVKDHAESEAQAKQSLKSFQKYDWNDVSLREGYTPETMPRHYFDYPLISNGRLDGIAQRGERTHLRKLACIANQIRLWREVVETDQPMSFIEHDAICVGRKQNSDFSELLCYNIEYAFEPPSVLGSLNQFKGYKPPLSFDPKPLPFDYPLTYYKNNIYNGHAMIPGTAHYGITPKGAKKLLYKAETTGLDQSDFFINTYNIVIEYINPSPTRFNKVNLNLSHKI